ncbi:uncharacterized protein PFLUO_LOCUS9342 [Penicillium psychrofluorescens]|uniref:uncharacterized protein n=1 Tax=Penicillium psychrofluorescens TaxID=3158075 RepID=UPI003CCCB085
MSQKGQNDFSQEVVRCRQEYQEMRQASNLFPPATNPILDMTNSPPGEKPSMTIWYEDGTEMGTSVRLYDIPGTLSGDIFRLRKNLPSATGPFEVEGNTVRQLDHCLEPPEPNEDDFEDISDLITELPLINVDTEKHFVKKGKYRSEIENLLRCQGGSCLGNPLSPRIVKLLGRSHDGQLVFQKLLDCRRVLADVSSLNIYKRWILDIIEALSCLHSLGIVHRDLRLDNCLFSENGERLTLCDLESRWGQRAAPEIANDGLDVGWTTSSDIFDIGNCIKCMVYANFPITKYVEWVVPSPLDAIVEACMRPVPNTRPSLEELKTMVESLE